MRHALLAAVAASALTCGSPNKPVPDAGPDTSCGLDCAAQSRYGLIVNRCFEYSTDPLTAKDPADWGVLVLPVAKLEGGVEVIPVEYRRYGQIQMRDSFMIQGGSLLLARRELTSSSRSVTYRDAAANITGVKWLNLESGPNETLSTDSQAFVVNQSGQGTTEATNYRVTTSEASITELRTPVQRYDAGVKLVTFESPTDHFHDPRRVFVPDVGFVVLASPGFDSSSTALALQRIRTVGVPDAGPDCSLGGP